MNIQSFEVGPLSTNIYLLTSPRSREAALVDTSIGAHETLKTYLYKHDCEIKHLLITHGHWDHTADAIFFQQEGAAIYANKADSNWIQNPMQMRPFIPEDISLEGASVDHFLEEGQTLNFFDEPIEIYHVPGHAPGSLCYYLPKSKCAFVGDTLFAGSVGRTDLPGGNWETLKKSIQEKIYSFPDETILYTGHGPFTTVQKEKSSNPFVKGTAL